MQKSEERLIGGWAQVEYSDINEVNSIGVDDLPELTESEVNTLMGFKKKAKRTRHHDIDAVLALLSGREIDVETNTVFGKRTEKEFVMQPFRSIEEHEAEVERMTKRGYAFDSEDKTIADKFSPRELAPVAQMIFGVINSRPEDGRTDRLIHKRAR